MSTLTDYAWDNGHRLTLQLTLIPSLRDGKLYLTRMKSFQNDELDSWAYAIPTAVNG